MPNDSRQAGAQLSEGVTAKMIDEGLAAYRENAAHDELSWVSPRQLVELILERALRR